MPSCSIVRSTPVKRTVRVAQLEGIFDIQPSEQSQETWEVHLPLDDQPWNIGLIVGPSGCGKSTIAHEIFGDSVCKGFEWSSTRSLVDDFPETMSIKEITALLSSVGFSSPPLWLRPFGVLSNGQQMRVTIARLLAEQHDLAVMDEFSSVVDRTVAQIGSAAIAKTVRSRKQQFVAVTCHYDVLEWLQPDWVYEPHLNRFQWRCLQRRPHIELEVCRVHYSAWELFKHYHYLNHSAQRSARYFAAFYQGNPIAIHAVINTPHPKSKNLYRDHRVVCLPDYQGVGIGNALVAHVASAYRALNKRLLGTTASPAMNASRKKDPRWKCLIKPHFASPSTGRGTVKTWRTAYDRLTTTWEYIGPPMNVDDAKKLIYG